MLDHGQSKHTRIAKFYLFLAAVFNLSIAFFAIWSVALGADRIEQFGWVLRVIMLLDFSGLVPEFLQMFWPALISGIACLVAFGLAWLSNPTTSIGKFTYLFPVAIVIIALGYVLAVRYDIHVIAISLIPLAGALWEYRKAAKSKMSPG